MNYLDLEDRLYTSTEVAKILGVSLRSVYRYLEDAKLDAEIKTATGRHRFTKQNIMDFLSPQLSRKSVSTPSMTDAPMEQMPKSSVSSSRSATEDSRPVSVSSRISTKPVFDEDEDLPETSYTPLRSQKMTPIVDDDDDEDLDEDTYDAQVEVVEERREERREVVSSKTEEDTTPRRTSRVEEIEEEEVDWLAKFRAAAEKYKAEVKASEEPARVAESVKIPEPSHTRQNVQHVSGLASFSDDEYESPKKTSSDEYYYTSAVGGLKDIAQNLDKSATKASLDYAFTMDAGLSLHKPIRPFSLIHSYVRSEDLPFFEKILGLKQVDKADAQLCLIASDDNDIFSSSREMHGLKVVSNSQLKADLIAEGKADLAKELN